MRRRQSKPCVRPFFEADPGFERGAGTLDRPLDAVVGRTEEPLYRQSFA